MQRQSTVALWCERLIEGGWLLAVVLIPSYFNLLSSRHFEPDKATTLRAIVLAMLAAALIRWLDGVVAGPQRAAEQPPPGPSLWRRLLAFPMALPVLLYMLVFLFATAISITPYTSFWGSYQRLQGTYTNLSYIGLGALIVFHLRRREQLDRLVVALVLGSLPAVGYGLVQHAELDPLPWRGDVVTRVASTMGNSIFVAAYMILVLPFALARSIGALHSARSAPRAERPVLDLLWGAAYGLPVLGGLLIIFAALQFGAVVHTADLRYWWIYPGALIAAFGLFLLPTINLDRSERSGAVIWPGIVTLGYAILVGVSFLMGGADGGQSVSGTPGRPGVDWPLWMVGGLALAAIGYGLIFALPRRADAPARLLLWLEGLAMLVIAGLLLATIFFTQSRGPWIGGATGMLVFFTLLLLLAWRRARAHAAPHARLLGRLLVAEVILVALVGGFLIAFNLSNAPFFEQLRSTPYIGRLGRLLEVDEGTGLVRRLIWAGDEKAGGAVALIASDPLRAVVGWGPESMFVAYNRFYPPALANIESRGASPDRSHQAYLDELITKGAIGLASYVFVLISFFTLARRLIGRSDDWPTQVLLTGCVAAVSAHAVEGLTGIPIVASLMLLWVTIAITVSVGALMGEYSLRPAPAAEAPALAAPEPATPPQRSAGRQGQGRQRRQPGARSSGRSAAAPRGGSAKAGGATALLLYALIAVAALGAVWAFNVDNVYADMQFQQGQNYTEDPSADLDRFIVGTAYYIDAIRMEPQQDFYYLNLGRSLMSIVDIRRQAAGIDLGAPLPEANVEELLRLQEPADVQAFVLQQPPLAIMSYAEATLLRAYELSPLNKDHYANMGRMYSFWYNRLQQDPALLQRAVDWYRRGTETAPQDVTILNEYASAIAIQANEARKQGDEATAQARFAEAGQLLEKSRQIDPRYGDTDVRLAEVLRLEGRYAEAVDQYVVLLSENPRALDNQITTIVEMLRGQPELLLKLRAAYEAAVAANPNDYASHALIGLIAARGGDLPRAAAAFVEVIRIQPQNLEARQNYTLVLSDMMQYQQASAQAEELLRLAAQQNLSAQDRSALEALLAFMQAKAQGR